MLALAASSAQAAGPATPMQPIRLEYAVDVGADGKLGRLEPARELPPVLAAWISDQLATYDFRPAKMNGTPQPASTTLYVRLGPVVDAAGKPAYRIEEVSTGPQLLRATMPANVPQPRTPGAGYFVIAYDASGQVTGATIDAGKDAVGGGPFRRWAKALAQSFRVRPETIAGVGVPGKALVPIVFCPSEAACPTLAPPPPEYGRNLNGEMVADSVLRAVAPGQEG